jgi:Tfp pilus assembly protein PilO
VSQGLANLDKIIEGYRCIEEGLEELGGEISGELESLGKTEKQLSELKDRFFMKTVAAVPATKKCLDEIEKVYSALEGCKAEPNDDSINGLKKALTGLADAAEELVDKSQMRVTTLT